MPSAGRDGRAREDHVGHVPAAERPRPLLAERPADRVDEVRLARAVGADDHRHARDELQDVSCPRSDLNPRIVIDRRNIGRMLTGCDSSPVGGRDRLGACRRAPTPTTRKQVLAQRRLLLDRHRGDPRAGRPLPAPGDDRVDVLRGPLEGRFHPPVQRGCAPSRPAAAPGRARRRSPDRRRPGRARSRSRARGDALRMPPVSRTGEYAGPVPTYDAGRRPARGRRPERLRRSRRQPVRARRRGGRAARERTRSSGARAAGALVVYTQDWHPPSHARTSRRTAGSGPSTASRTRGAPSSTPTCRLDGEVVRKGVDGGDGYSGFSVRDPGQRARPSPTPLVELLRDARDRAAGRSCGLATDYCVVETVARRPDARLPGRP